MIIKERPDDYMAEMDVVECYLLYGDAFLLLQRQQNKSQGGKWGLPAGKVESGEELARAVMREVREETGVALVIANLVQNNSYVVGHELKYFNYHTFFTELPELPQIVLSNPEHRNYRWVTPLEALEMDLIHDQAECTKLFFHLK